MLVRRLTDRGLRIRVLTRQAARAAPLTGPAVEVVTGDVRDAASLPPALSGVDVVVSAVPGFGGSDVSPGSVDRQGNIHLIDAAAAAGAAVVLVSIVGGAADHPIDLFRAKYDAEQHVCQSSVAWTIVRATAFIETWVTIMVTSPRPPNKILVLGRGENPVNFVSASDVAALLELAVVDQRLRGRVLELGGANMTMNEVAAMLQAAGERDPVRHVARKITLTEGGLSCRTADFSASKSWRRNCRAVRSRRTARAQARTADRSTGAGYRAWSSRRLWAARTSSSV
jgi:uncharacterized protein YbjT (DUF2867 family)